MDFDFAIHAQRKLVVSGAIPGRVALGANRFQHIDLVNAHDDFFIGLGYAANFEDIRERIVFRVIVDDLNAPFLVLVERAEDGVVARHIYSSYSVILFAYRTEVLNRNDTPSSFRCQRRRRRRLNRPLREPCPACFSRHAIAEAASRLPLQATHFA